MPATAAAGGGGVLTVAKMLLGNSAKIFAFIFVAFMLVSTLSQTANAFEKTRSFTDLGIGIGKSIIKPIVASDNTVFKAVAEFSVGNLAWYTQILLWINMVGAISTMYFVYKWIILRLVKSLFPDGMNSNFSIHIASLYVLFSMSTIYNTASSGHLMVGGAGLWSLFMHFTLVFQPILAIGEPILKTLNLMPDSNVPIFKP